MQVGLNEAILLQQLHFRSFISTHIRDGHIWVYKIVDDWKNKEIPFWSVDTIKRTIRRLEDSGYVISTASHNRMKMENYAKGISLTIKSCNFRRCKMPYRWV